MAINLGSPRRFRRGFTEVGNKFVQSIGNIHKAQLLTYLKLARKKVGLSINFNVEYPK